jgi:hypothetical protein
LGTLALFIAKILRFVLVRYILVTEEGSHTQKLAGQWRMQLFINGKMRKYRRYVGSCRLATNDEASFWAGFERSGILRSLVWILANDTEDIEGVKIYPLQSIPRIVDRNWEWIFGREAIGYIQDYSPKFGRQGSTKGSEC